VVSVPRASARTQLVRADDRELGADRHLVAALAEVRRPNLEERASLRAWLYRIATNRCLNALRNGRRRPARLMAPPDPPFEPPEPTRRGEPVWLQPYPDALLEGVADLAAGPDARYETKEAVGLAFVAGLQHLPPQQRAVLVLRDVLGFRAIEVARMLDSSEASVNSALKRARTALETRLPAGDRERAPVPRSRRELDLVARFTDAFENDDVDRVVALLTDDAWYTMPPVTLEYQGPATIARFLRESERWRATRSYRLVPTRANGQPAFGCYLRDAHAPLYRAHGLLVLTLEGDRISAITRFTDSSILARFGLPRALPTYPGVRATGFVRRVQIGTPAASV
jgi:RNA polymerase sigma-70 factor (TIGR02960 family)